MTLCIKRRRACSTQTAKACVWCQDPAVGTDAVIMGDKSPELQPRVASSGEMARIPVSQSFSFSNLPQLDSSLKHNEIEV